VRSRNENYFEPRTRTKRHRLLTVQKVIGGILPESGVGVRKRSDASGVLGCSDEVLQLCPSADLRSAKGAIS